MRTANEVLALVTTIAENDHRVIGGLLVGSRATEGVRNDKYQDYDIIYVVQNLEEFIADPQWIRVFGTPVLMQTPDSMKIPKGSMVDEKEASRFAYLMLFADYVRIDLTLTKLDSLASVVDTPATILVDKEDVLQNAIATVKVDQFLVTKPTQRDFTDCCNEFWWVSAYVVKGLLRSELLYAKRKLERPLRDMLLLMMSWKVGHDFNYSINLGSEYRFLKTYLSEDEWTNLRNTYPLLSQQSIWESLTAMVAQFERMEKDVAKKLGYPYSQAEIDAGNRYLRDTFPDIAASF